MQYIVAAYVLWGVFPAFFPLLDPASPLEILAHRIIWTAVLMVGILLVTGRWREIYEVRAATWWRLAAAGVVITVNWGTYVVAVMNDHVADASLGYYMNPLVSVALGVLILREHLRRWQMVAVAIAAVAVAYLTFLSGQPPVIALALAFSFGTYGLLKKKVNVSAFFSVGAETMIMLPLALGYVAYISVNPEQQSTFASEGWGHALLMMSCGLVTATPLLFYARGAHMLPLSTIGMLQYLTPTILMLWALFITQEPMSQQRWIGFIIIWVAVAVYVADLVRMRRHSRREQRRQTVSFAGTGQRDGSAPTEHEHVALATNTNDQCGTAPLRNAQMTSPTMTVHNHTMAAPRPLRAPLTVISAVARESNNQPRPSPIRNGHSVDNQPTKDNGMSADWWAIRASKANTASAMASKMIGRAGVWRVDVDMPVILRRWFLLNQSGAVPHRTYPCVRSRRSK